jgi:hypothetical protein
VKISEIIKDVKSNTMCRHSPHLRFFTQPFSLERASQFRSKIEVKKGSKHNTSSGNDSGCQVDLWQFTVHSSGELSVRAGHQFQFLWAELVNDYISFEWNCSVVTVLLNRTIEQLQFLWTELLTRSSKKSRERNWKISLTIDNWTKALPTLNDLVQREVKHASSVILETVFAGKTI